jgi:hypothetical protein
MKNDNVVELIQPGEFKDHLTKILLKNSQGLIFQAVETEFAAL